MNNKNGAGLPRATSGQNNNQPNTAGGGIERVNVFDGLFLRAEHLNSIQDYARDLALAVGASGGPGVVFGFRVTLEGSTIEIAPGLAIDPHGRPLRSRYPITVSLKGFDLAGGNFAWVEIVSTSWTWGDEPVQGVLCEDPCSGSASTGARRSEGVLAKLRPQFEPALEGTPSESKRSRLASLLFGKEHTSPSNWLFPGDASPWPRVQQPLLDQQDWLPPASPGDKLPGVRLAVLISDQSAWQLDTWIARRDRGEPPPVRFWQTQLGMRPWDVFVAQVLQFQDQLGAQDSVAQMILDVTKPDLVADLTKIAEDLEANVTSVTKKVAAARIRQRAGSLTAKTRPSLSARGIIELPPAGFLAVTGTGGQLRDELVALLGGAKVVDLRLCPGPLSDLGAFLRGAQHRDRIPLTTGVQPIDIFVPQGFGADWVAFARREERVCVSPTRPADKDLVKVFVIKEDADDDGKAYRAWRDSLKDPLVKHPTLPDKPNAVVEYPPRSWTLPTDPNRISEQLFDEVDMAGTSAVAIVSHPSRRALGVARASLLALHVDQTEAFTPELRCIVDTDPTGTESIVILVPNPDNDG